MHTCTYIHIRAYVCASTRTCALKHAHNAHKHTSAQGDQALLDRVVCTKLSVSIYNVCIHNTHYACPPGLKAIKLIYACIYTYTCIYTCT